jgi:hypothetical protein
MIQFGAAKYTYTDHEYLSYRPLTRQMYSIHDIRIHYEHEYIYAQAIRGPAWETLRVQHGQDWSAENCFQEHGTLYNDVPV